MLDRWSFGSENYLEAISSLSRHYDSCIITGGVCFYYSLIFILVGKCFSPSEKESVDKSADLGKTVDHPLNLTCLIYV